MPEAPDDLYLQKLDDYYTTYVQEDESEEEPIDLVETVEIDDRFKSEQFEEDLDIFNQIQLISE